METKLQELRERLHTVDDVNSANAVLGWDQTTYMPDGGAPARGRQSATLGRIAHELFTDPAIGRLLDDLRPYEESLPYDNPDAALIRVTRREYERATRVPSAFVAEMGEHQAASYQTWAAARGRNDFAAVQPYLEKTLDLSRRYADFFPGYEHVADPLIDVSDYDMKASIVRPLFASLRDATGPHRRSDHRTCRPPTTPVCAGRTPRRNSGSSGWMSRAASVTISSAAGWTRPTTRSRPSSPSATCASPRVCSKICSRLRCSPPSTKPATPCTSRASTRPSRARRWPTARPPASTKASRACGRTSSGAAAASGSITIRCCKPNSPHSSAMCSLDEFYRAINKVERSLIRVEADEVTYNLHIMLRFELELALLEGKLAVRDLPDAWNARYTADLGITPPDNRDGVMQDVHWYMGTIGGMFQGYTLGNILGAQFYEAALAAHPEIPAQIEQGEFATLLGWLRDNIYTHGSVFTAAELVQRVTGGPLTIEPYLRYLRDEVRRSVHAVAPATCRSSSEKSPS